MAVSSILQAPFPSSSVTPHPNHHEIKMFPFNVIKDDNNTPTEPAVCVICYKCSISRLGSTAPWHLVMSRPSMAQLLLAPSPSLLLSAPPGFPWVGTKLRGKAQPGFLFPPHSQEEKKHGMVFFLFICSLWQRSPPTLVVSWLGRQWEESKIMICGTVSQSYCSPDSHKISLLLPIGEIYGAAQWKVKCSHRVRGILERFLFI